MERSKPDENNDEIALAELKFSKDGNYIPNSLSISPLAWAMKKMSNGITNASEKLSVSEYSKEIKNIEKQSADYLNPYKKAMIYQKKQRSSLYWILFHMLC